METVIKEFETEDTIYYSEYSNKMFPAVLYWLSNRDDLTEIVKKVEEQKEILVYHAIITPTIYGTHFTLLYVSNCQEEWENDREELQQGFPNAYCINLADPEMAEFGGIQIGGAIGGIRQLA